MSISLEQIRVTSPCHADWNSMKQVSPGDDRTRFCAGCCKNVYNLSLMTRAEAQQVVQDHDGHLCVRFQLQENGTMHTRDDSPLPPSSEIHLRGSWPTLFVIAGLVAILTACTLAGCAPSTLDEAVTELSSEVSPGKHLMGKPEPGHPKVGQPEVGQPEVGQLEVGQPGVVSEPTLPPASTSPSVSQVEMGEIIAAPSPTPAASAVALPCPTQETVGAGAPVLMGRALPEQ